MKKLRLAILAISLFLSGCMSVLGTVEGGACYPYSGMKFASSMLGYSESKPWLPLIIVDFPFSLVLDTVLLPLTGTRAVVADTCEDRTWNF